MQAGLLREKQHPDIGSPSQPCLRERPMSFFSFPHLILSMNKGSVSILDVARPHRYASASIGFLHPLQEMGLAQQEIAAMEGALAELNKSSLVVGPSVGTGRGFWRRVLGCGVPQANWKGGPLLGGGVFVLLLMCQPLVRGFYSSSFCLRILWSSSFNSSLRRVASPSGLPA